MENIILIVHLIIAIVLIGVVLLQRSEGGALGMGGGGGGVMSSRSAATALSKVTWGLAGAFIATSLTLTILAASGSGSRSVIQGVDTGVPAAEEPVSPAAGGFALPNLKQDEPEAPAPTEPPAAD